MKSEYYHEADISGAVALITGASSGIGEAIAWRLAELRCNLVLCARRTERLSALKASLEAKHNIAVHIVTVDVTDVKGVSALSDSLPAKYIEVDFLVNNAGLALGTAPVHENDVQDTLKMINTNISAVAILTSKFTPGMVQRNRGHIVNISSIAAHHTYPGGSIYCGTKHFIDAYTNVARHDLVGSNIRITSISPGAVKTEFSVVRYQGDEAKADSIYEGFVPLNAADCADSVVYALTRPAHVQIGEIVLYATNQSSPQSIARVLKTDSLPEPQAYQLNKKI